MHVEAINFTQDNNILNCVSKQLLAWDVLN